MPKPTAPAGFVPGGMESRAARFDASSYDAEARTIEVVISTGSRVRRWGIIEELAIDAESIDLARVDLGQIRFLDHHNSYKREAVLGMLESAEVRDAALVGTVRFADTEAARDAEGMVERGELTGISAGYRVHAWERVAVEDDVDVWRATRWELLEVSLVSVPADPHAGVRSATPEITHSLPGAAGNRKEADMPNTPDNRPADVTPAAPDDNNTRTDTVTPPTSPSAPAAAPGPDLAAERQRSGEITDLARRHSMPEDFARRHIEAGTAVADVRGEILDALAERAPSRAVTGASVTVTNPGESPDDRRAAMEEALSRRILGVRGQTDPVSERAQEFMDWGFADLAADFVGHRGRLNARQRDDVLYRAMHSTSDFPLLLENVANNVLLTRYQEATPIYRQIASRRNLTDFKPVGAIRMGDFPTLLEVGENGEIKAGTFSESKETFSLATYARQIRIGRNLMINDDLGGIDQVLGSIGARIADFEEGIAWTAIAANAALSDGTALFHAGHGNLAAAGGNPSVTTIGAARAAMRKQTSPDGLKLNIRPSLIVVGPDDETTVEQLLTTITPAQTSNVVPASMARLTPSATSWITGTEWYLFADPSNAPCFQYGHLDGAEGPQVRTDEPFNTLGWSLRVVLDFGFAGIDHRGGYKNPGAG